MARENIQAETYHLREKLKNYKAGSIEGLDKFTDAAVGEMEGLQIRLAVFGMTGAGKSSLVNTVWKTLYGKDTAPAIEQSSGAEGTRLLEDFSSRAGKENQLGGFVFNDTRGFNFDFSNAEESESKICVFFKKYILMQVLLQRSLLLCRAKQLKENTFVPFRFQQQRRK